MQIKKERLQSIIKKEISRIIFEDVKDPTIGFVTITDVVLTNDYSIAKVYVSFLDKIDINDYRIKNLNKAKGLIRNKLAHKLSIRKCPELIFVIDDSLQKGNHIEEVINKLKENENCQ